MPRDRMMDGMDAAWMLGGLAIAVERYARGEIDHEEFEERRRRLSQ